MVDGLTRDVTSDEIEEFRESGVVNLKGILSRAWVDLLGSGLDEVSRRQRNPSLCSTTRPRWLNR